MTWVIPSPPVRRAWPWIPSGSYHKLFLTPWEVKYFLTRWSWMLNASPVHVKQKFSPLHRQLSPSLPSRTAPSEGHADSVCPRTTKCWQPNQNDVVEGSPCQAQYQQNSARQVRIRWNKLNKWSYSKRRLPKSKTRQGQRNMISLRVQGMISTSTHVRMSHYLIVIVIKLKCCEPQNSPTSNDLTWWLQVSPFHLSMPSPVSLAARLSKRPFRVVTWVLRSGDGRYLEKFAAGVILISGYPGVRLRSE